MIVNKAHYLEAVRKSNSVGKPMTPGYWRQSRLTTIPVTEILVTYGGGMGGVSKKFFINRVALSDIRPNEMIEVETWDGNKFVINSNFIVYAKQMGIATGIFHSDNSNFKTGDWEYAYLVEDGRIIKCNNDVFENHR